jgi:hypothetical protein
VSRSTIDLQHACDAPLLPRDFRRSWFAHGALIGDRRREIEGAALFHAYSGRQRISNAINHPSPDDTPTTLRNASSQICDLPLNATWQYRSDLGLSMRFDVRRARQAGAAVSLSA